MNTLVIGLSRFGLLFTVAFVVDEMDRLGCSLFKVPLNFARDKKNITPFTKKEML